MVLSFHGDSVAVKIFPKYVLKETLLSFLLALAAFTLMLFVGNSLKFITEQVPLVRFLRIIPYLSVFILTFTMPMAILTAVVFTFGRLGLDNELAAIRASGLSLSVVVVPTLALALFLSLLSLPLNTWIGPECHYRIEAILLGDPSNPEAQWSDRHEPTMSLPSCDVYIGDTEGDVYRDVFICKTVNGKPSQFIAADTATLSIDRKHHELRFNLGRGIVYYIEKGISESGAPMSFDNNTLSIELPSARAGRRSLKELSLKELRGKIQDGSLPKHWQPKAVTESHKRISISFSCLALVLVGIPLGILTKRGNFVAAFGASVGIIFVLYYPLFLIGEVLGNMGRVSPAISMWIANAAAACVGAVLFFRARRAV